MTDTASLALNLSLLLLEVGLMLLTFLGNCVGEPSSAGHLLKPPLEAEWIFHSAIPHYCFSHTNQCLTGNYGRCWEGREQVLCT